MDFNPDTDYHADIATYRRTRQALLEGPECKHKAWMISNLDYAIEWLETGRRPGNKRGVERLAAYQRDIPIDVMDKYAAPTPKVSLITDDDYAKVEFVLCMLSDQERECYELHIGQNYSMEDVAELLNISKSSVQTYLKRASNKVKAYRNRPIQKLLDIVV